MVADHTYSVDCKIHKILIFYQMLSEDWVYDQIVLKREEEGWTLKQ